MEQQSPFSKRRVYDESGEERTEGNRASEWWISLPSKISGWRSSIRVPQKLSLRVWGMRIGAGIVLFLVLYLSFIFFTLPDVDDIGALVAAESTAITDRNGIELYRIHGDEDRTFVPLAQIADSLEQATVAIEDERFFTRGCFDPRAFARAVFRNTLGIFGAQWGEGGSTITQQFAKNALIGSRRKRITRKLKEYILSCKLENRYTKEQVLELYLNRIPYGHNVHGAEQAAQTYFAKSASGLTLAEASVLAALPQLPSYLNPYGEHVRSTLSLKGMERFKKGKMHDASDVREDDFWLGLVGNTVGSGASLTTAGFSIGGRTDQVLRNMQDQGFITDEQRLQALQELQNITFKRARENIRAPHFVLSVREQLLAMFREQGDQEFLEQGGLHVTTTLDWKLQESAERVVAEVGQMNIDLYGAHNAAVLVADVRSGEILAYVGNRDYWDETSAGNVDIIRSPRQPGSSFKPFAYAAAFLRGFTPSTVLWDIPIEIGEDEPDNFDRAFWGPLTIRRSLGASRNIPAAESFVLAGGEESILDLAERMGVSSIRVRKEELSRELGFEYEYGWPLALGAAEVPLVEMVQGYLTFARGGKHIPLRSILKVKDRFGNILFSTEEDSSEENVVQTKEQDVLDPQTAYMITSVLSDESVRPTEYWRSQLSIPGYQTAAKTGTSNKCLKRAPPKKESQRTQPVEGKCIDLRPDNNWTIGYTPEIIAGAWVGNASGGAMFPKASGLDTASHIWKPVMVAAHRGLPNLRTTFPVPVGLVSIEISELSGKLPAPCTPLDRRRSDFFRSGEIPKDLDDACAELEVDKLTGLLASDECPADAREKRAFFTPKSIFMYSRSEWERAVQAWALGLRTGTGSIFRSPTGALRGSGAFLPLPLPLAPSEECRLSLTPGRLIKPTLSILSPRENDIASFPIFTPRIEYTVGHRVTEVLYELDGKLVARSFSGSTIAPVPSGSEGSVSGPAIRLTRRFDPSGTHALKVTLTDSYFNTVTDSVRFRFEAGEEERPVRRPRRGTGGTVAH